MGYMHNVQQPDENHEAYQTCFSKADSSQLMPNIVLYIFSRLAYIMIVVSSWKPIYLRIREEYLSN